MGLPHGHKMDELLGLGRQGALEELGGGEEGVVRESVEEELRCEGGDHVIRINATQATEGWRSQAHFLLDKSTETTGGNRSQEVL